MAPASIVTGSARTGARRRAPRRLVRAKRSDLHRHEMRRLSLRDDVGGQLALKHRAHERRRTVDGLDRRHVGDERPVEPRGQLRREVARLIRVRQDDGRRLRARRSTCASAAVNPSDVYGSRAAASTVTTSCTCAALSSRGHRADVRAEDDDGHLTARGQLLRRRDRFPRRAVQLAVSLFRDDQDHGCQMTRASSRRRRTSSLAAARRRAVDHLGLLALLRRIQRGDLLLRRGQRGGLDAADLFLLGRHDALERRVAQLVDAALNRQQRRQRHAPPTGTSRPRARA